MQILLIFLKVLNRTSNKIWIFYDNKHQFQTLHLLWLHWHSFIFPIQVMNSVEQELLKPLIGFNYLRCINMYFSYAFLYPLTKWVAKHDTEQIRWLFIDLLSVLCWWFLSIVFQDECFLLSLTQTLFSTTQKAVHSYRFC